MMVSNKKGRKVKTTFGFVDKYVNTWALIEDEWMYQGLCKKRVVGTTEEGQYSYYINHNGIKIRQEM